MESNENRVRGTVLITGANSGVGFEAAHQLAEAGYKKVILGCRTIEKGEAARKLLIERGGKDVFESIALDTSEVNSALAASKELLSKGVKLDLLILNAGMSSGKVITKNSDGIDMTFASTLIGHHTLTMDLLSKGGISDNGKILITGSEAATGNVPGMGLPKLDELAKKDFNGNMHDLLKAYALASYPAKYVPMKAYAMAKLYVSWWSSSLSKKLQNGITVNTVSPGAVLSSNFARDMSWGMRNVMVPMMKLMGPIMKTNGPVSAAGERYMEVSQYGKEKSGKFYASRPKKMVGKLVEQRTPQILDEVKQEEGYKLIVELAGGIDYNQN